MDGTKDILPDWTVLPPSHGYWDLHSLGEVDDKAFSSAFLASAFSGVWHRAFLICCM